MKKVVLIFGIIAGVIVSGMMFLSLGNVEEIDFEGGGELLGYATMIIAFSTIFFGIRSYRDKYQSGSIKFGKAFLVGLYITLIATGMYVTSWMIISHGKEEQMMNNYGAYLTKEMKKEGATPEEINIQMEANKEMTEMYKKPLIKAGITATEILPVGLLVTLICAAILRKEEKPTQEVID